MTKKTSKAKVSKSSDESVVVASADHITTKAELNAYLQAIRDKMEEGVAAPLFALTALQYVMNRSNIYELLDSENREIARDIWLRVKKAGIQLREPALLF